MSDSVSVVEGRSAGAPDSVAGAPGRPAGRDEVRTAVLAAAVDLFSRFGPSAVSLRDIAKQANVNLGLLHRHFGSKADLVAAAIGHVVGASGASMAEQLAGPQPALEAARIATAHSEMQSYVRMLAWSLLEGADPRSLQADFPTVSALVRRLKDGGHEDQSARMAAAAVAALTLGWSLFEPYLRVATELDGTSPASLEVELAELIGRLFA